MKKLLAVLLAAVMLLSLAACGEKAAAPAATENKPTENTSAPEAAEKDLLAEIKERGYMVIATEGDWSPWTYHDENTGALVGFDVEIGTRIAEILGVEARFEETNWDSILAGVKSGRFDIACNGVGCTEERQKSYNFSDPYFYSMRVLIVAADNTDINSWDDLKGKKTGNTISSTYAAVAEEYGATVTAVDDFNQTIELLARGDIDATINAEGSYNDYIAQHPDAPIKVVARETGESCAYPAASGAYTESFIAAVNDALKQLRDSGELSAISVKYFGEDCTSGN